MLNTDWAGCVCKASWKEIKPSLQQLVVLNEKSKHPERHTQPVAECTELLLKYMRSAALCMWDTAWPSTVTVCVYTFLQAHICLIKFKNIVRLKNFFGILVHLVQVQRSFEKCVIFFTEWFLKYDSHKTEEKCLHNIYLTTIGPTYIEYVYD